MLLLTVSEGILVSGMRLNIVPEGEALAGIFTINGAFGPVICTGFAGGGEETTSLDSAGIARSGAGVGITRSENASAVCPGVETACGAVAGVSCPAGIPFTRKTKLTF